MNKVSIAALLLSAFAAHAEIVAVGVHIGSVHFVPRVAGEWNDTNPGVYIRTDADTVVGVLRNSEYKTSVYAAKVWETNRFAGLGLDLTLGAITGYRKPVVPLLTAGLSFRSGNTTFRASYLPKPPKSGSDAVHFSVEWSLK